MFKELLILSRITLTSQRTTWASVFTMDNSPTWALNFCSILCRDKAVRTEAMALLRDFPRRDAMWDTKVFLALY